MTDKVPTMPRWRILVLALLMCFGFYALISSLHTVQVEDSGKYANSQYRQSVRRVLIPAARGRIFDRNGVCLAYNRPSYCIAVYVEELRKPGRWSNTVNSVDAKLDDLADALGLRRQIVRKDIEQHVMKRLPLPLLAWQDIDDSTLARFAETITPDCGMDVYVQPERVYPRGKSAAHLLGYIGRDVPVVTNETFHYNIMGMKGRSGIEASMNNVLSGAPGGKLITVDVSGYRHSETNRPAIPGNDIRLTIDINLQEHLERLLGDNRGAAVAVDPRNGDILALVSSPMFDPNEMSPAVPTKLWKQLMADKEKPLLNRAVTGTYPPGSVFKPCVALAALASGVSQSIAYDCNGVFTLGKMHLRCSARAGHGPGITIRYGLEQSCNPFFCSLGVHIGIDAIRAFASQMGFGKRTGIKLGGESYGLLPDDAWKRRVYKDGWRTGDTANLAIGQGMLLVTPLQIAMYTAAVANGGTLFKPRLVLPAAELAMSNEQLAISTQSAGSSSSYAQASVKTNSQTENNCSLLIAHCSLFPGEVSNKLSIPPEHLKIVRGGMYDVVNAQYGTGRRARVHGLRLAAKTGTAEYGSRANRRKHTWMIAFAPFDNPEIALAVLVEDGESGGKTVAPIISEALRDYFGLEEGPASDEDPNSDPEVNPALQPAEDQLAIIAPSPEPKPEEAGNMQTGSEQTILAQEPVPEDGRARRPATAAAPEEIAEPFESGRARLDEAAAVPEPRNSTEIPPEDGRVGTPLPAEEGQPNSVPIVPTEGDGDDAFDEAAVDGDVTGCRRLGGVTVAKTDRIAVEDDARTKRTDIVEYAQTTGNAQAAESAAPQRPIVQEAAFEGGRARRPATAAVPDEHTNSQTRKLVNSLSDSNCSLLIAHCSFTPEVLS